MTKFLVPSYQEAWLQEFEFTEELYGDFVRVLTNRDILDVSDTAVELVENAAWGIADDEDMPSATQDAAHKALFTPNHPIHEMARTVFEQWQPKEEHDG